MPDGAVLTSSVEAALGELAAAAATGCLAVQDQEGEQAEVYLRDGQVYAVAVPGRRVMLGVRLMSSGALTPEALAEALEIQRTELQGWRLGELLVHLGYVDLATVEEFVVEHLKDALADLLGWPIASWKFRRNKKTRQDVAPPMPVGALLDDLRSRATTWEQILAAIGGPEQVPDLASGPPSDDVPLGPNEWALLCKVDNARTVAELAVECGFTLFEAGQVVMRLMSARLVEVAARPDVRTPVAAVPASPAPLDEAPAEVDVATLEDVRTGADIEADDISEVAIEAGDDVGPELVLPVIPLAEVEAREAARRAEQEARDAAEREAAEREAAEREARRAAEVAAREAAAREEAERRERARAAERKRLQEAEILHRELEALAQKEAAARAERATARRQAREAEERQQREQQAAAERTAVEEQAWADHAQWLAARRQADEEQARADHHAWSAQQRTTDEPIAWADHAAWLAAQRAAAEAVAWEDHGHWLADQRHAAEEPAWADHQQWVSLQRVAAEEAAWVDHGHWLAEQRRAVEAQAWDEHAHWLTDREAEQRAREEAERRAAEAIAAEEAERRAAEEAEAIAAEEAERLAAEQRELEQQVADTAALAAQAASMLTELTRDLPVPNQPDAQPPAEPAGCVGPVDGSHDDTATHAETPAVDQPEPLVDRGLTDTAMLLRELSSLTLGLDDDRSAGPPASPPPARPAPSPAPLDAKKKRKGLFGRG